MELPIVMCRHRTLILALALSVLYGCAPGGSLIRGDQLTIDKISSDRASIGAVYVRNAAEGIDVFGKVTFKKAIIGIPPDHVVVTITDRDGKIFYTGDTHYYRYGKPIKQSDTFNFSLAIPLTPPKGSIMRLVNESSS